MTLLDRFRTQTRDTHPDPAVRLAYVQEIPIDQRDVLAAIARTDDDARVRRAAVAKLMDPPALADIARADGDEDVRAAANGMLRDLALEAFEGIGETESRAAVEALADPRMLSTVAKTAANPEVALAALARIADPHMRGSIARHAAHEPVRMQALEGVSERAELLAIAMNGEFKDSAAAAVERFTAREDLEHIAARAKNKNAVKRARVLVREMDERAVRDAIAAAQAAETERFVPAATEEAAPVPSPEDVAAERSAREAEATAREELAAAERAQRDAAEREGAERDAADRKRVEDAARQEAERRHGRLAELATAAAAAADLEDVAAARKQLSTIRREWRDLVAGITVDADLAARFADAEQRFSARDAALREEDQKARRDALARVQQLLARVDPLVQRPDLTLKAAERTLRDVRAALGQMPPLPSKQDYDDVMRRLKAVQSALTPKVVELREVADWQRWANVGIQEQLCEKMEALAQVEDLEQVASTIRELQQQWRQASDVPRAQGAALWQRFKTAHDTAWARCEAHFAAQAAVRAENLAKKIALCERAEALADSTAWISTADELKKLQADWKTIGQVSRGQEKAIWDRFRTACDRFFTRRQADLAQRKTVWAENLAKKEALCVKAEALAGSTDWEPAANEIRKLQAEWRTIGPVKKTRSEAIWQRFRAACDAFFSRYAQRHDIARGERAAAREAIVSELEALAPSAPVVEAAEAPAAADAEAGASAAPQADVVAAVRDIRRRWQAEIAARGVDRERAVALDERFNAAFARVLWQHASAFAGTDLDPESNRKRMEAIVKRIEELAQGLAGPQAAADAALSPSTRLAMMLKEALAANTIGGKVDDDSRWRAAAEDVRQAQASWSRIGPVSEDVRRPLAERFARACRRITERPGAAPGAAGRTAGPGRAGGPGRATRS
ncbi:MAG TPA: DUF349 domain-containing protein [Vicinamibacterales bacterium]|jgi:hypothetical protein